MVDEPQAMLARFRAATATTPRDPTRRAIWRRLQRDTDRSAMVPWIAGLALAAAALLVVTWGWRSSLQPQRRAEASQALDRAPSQPDARARVVAPPAVAEPPPPVARVLAPEPAAAPLQRPRAGVLPQTPRSDALAREAALMRQATAAARSGDRAAAWRHLAAHAREFPDGALVPERFVLQIELACGDGDVAAAGAHADAFVRAFPRDAAAGRLRARPCGAVTNSAAGGQLGEGAR